MPRVHCPEERSKAEEVENYQYTSALMGRTIETVLRTMFSDNQLSFYRAVPGLCEECDSGYARTGRPALAGQSGPLFVPTSSLMKTRKPLTDHPAQEDLLQKVPTTKLCD